jgi:hypothetical protein
MSRRSASLVRSMAQASPFAPRGAQTGQVARKVEEHPPSRQSVLDTQPDRQIEHALSGGRDTRRDGQVRLFSQFYITRCQCSSDHHSSCWHALRCNELSIFCISILVILHASVKLRKRRGSEHPPPHVSHETRTSTTHPSLAEYPHLLRSRLATCCAEMH